MEVFQPQIQSNRKIFVAGTHDVTHAVTGKKFPRSKNGIWLLNLDNLFFFLIRCLRSVISIRFERNLVWLFQTEIFSKREAVQPRDWLNDKRCYHNLSTRLDISPKWVNMIIQKQITSYFAHYLSHTVWLIHFIKFIRNEVATSKQGSADRWFI